MRDTDFAALAANLAPAIHAFSLHLAHQQGESITYDRPYEQLIEMIQVDNRAAAPRIPKLLRLAGLSVTPQDRSGQISSEAVRPISEDHIERLAEAEHDGWIGYKRQIGQVMWQAVEGVKAQRF